MVKTGADSMAISLTFSNFVHLKISKPHYEQKMPGMVSISAYLPFLFTYEKVKGMPNTNNMIEGTFTDMKKALRNHPGMTAENRRRMVNGFFLAYEKQHNTKEGTR